MGGFFWQPNRNLPCLIGSVLPCRPRGTQILTPKRKHREGNLRPWLTSCLTGIGGIAFSLLPAQAQIIPDATLPNNSLVTPNGNTFVIEEGTRVGGNLFHSFSEFSLPGGSQAIFNNALDLQNIISRVTGGTISNINGLIQANGTANLFFLNPNGIIFGPQAQLNIGGSFIASTADSIRLLDGSSFSATNPQAPSLLTINVPIGLQFGSNPGSIRNQSQATSLVPLPPQFPLPDRVGLEVRPGQTLALLGGDVFLEGGHLTAFQGQIALGSVAGLGVVSFTPTSTGLVLGYEGRDFGDIELSGAATVTASGLGGGMIQLRGGQVTLKESSRLVADTLGDVDGRGIQIQANQFRLQEGALVSALALGEGAGGSLTVSASDSVELIGEGSLELVEQAIEGNLDPSVAENALLTLSFGNGPGGDLSITTRNLIVQDGAVISAGTAGSKPGGNLRITASESVELTRSALNSGSIGSGNGGKLTLNTGRLIARNGGVISSSNNGPGKGGDVEVTASESVELIGVTPTRTFFREISSSLLAGTNGSGPSGNITLNTGKLIIRDGAAISASTLFDIGEGGDVAVTASESVEVIGSSGSGFSRSGIFSTTSGPSQAGDLQVNTGRLTIQDGGQISVSTFGTGRGGTLRVRASESIEVSGVAADGFSSGILASSGVFNPTLNIFIGTGPGGDLNIKTGQLTVRDGAEVSVTSTVGGDAGNLEVEADAILLDNQGRIIADNEVGGKGNINLQTGELLMRRGSLISTNAGTADSGNITIEADVLVALENSDITANAQQGAGGRVSITTQGIFGTEFRERLTPESDITATSELGPEFNGTVVINLEGIDPSQGLVELPGNFIDSSQKIASGCAADQGNEFVMTGRGGLPANPTQALRGSTVWQDVRNLSVNRSASFRGDGEVGRRGDAGTRGRGDGGMGETRRTRERRSSIPDSQFPIPNSQFPVEAQGWVIHADGSVELVAYVPEVTPYSPQHQSKACLR